MKTEPQIADLKRQWEYDPIWDIETTEGFEDHKEDLLNFRLEKEEEWNQMRLDRDESRCVSLGLEFPSQLPLLALINRLEKRIEQLEHLLQP